MASELKDYPNTGKLHPAALCVFESIRCHITGLSSTAPWEKQVRMEVWEKLVLTFWTKDNSASKLLSSAVEHPCSCTAMLITPPDDCEAGIDNHFKCYMLQRNAVRLTKSWRGTSFGDVIL